MPKDEEDEMRELAGAAGDRVKVSARVLKAWLEVQQRQASLRSDLAAVADFLNRGGHGRELQFRLFAILLTSTVFTQDLFKCVLDLVRDEYEER